MEARYNIYGGATLVLAVLTCMAAFKVAGVDFFGRVELCYYAFLGAAAVVAVFFFETSLSIYQWPLIRMKFVWPLALLFVWTAFHEVLQIWGKLEPVVDELGYPIVTGFEPNAWYASTLVYWLGALAILAYGYIGDRLLFSEQ